MRPWHDDPAYQAVRRAFVDGDPLEQEGAPLDVRAVVADVPAGVKDRFLTEKVPWARFPEGDRVRAGMERLHPDDPGPEDDRDPWSFSAGPRLPRVSQTVMKTREGPAVADGRAFTCAC
ncbi:hypothetical protein [Streptomyces thermolilacinus]|uniref:hypothetical protein n=1 Tax=Streptomyces thermolilacinus TaxID=285540 RepID=UPI0033F93D98